MAREIIQASVYVIDADGTAHKMGDLQTVELKLPKPRIYVNPIKFTHSFKMASKAAKKLNRELRRAFKPKTPYKVWGNYYKNLSLSRKVIFKNSLKFINKTTL